MHEDTATRRVREIVADAADLDLADVTVDALFYDDLMLDSLQKLQIVVQIERVFGVRLTNCEAAGVQRVRDALAMLRDKGMLAPAGTRDG